MLQPTVGTIIFGRYRLRRELARGGMGSVWEAEDKKLRRTVAVKLLFSLWAESSEALARFEREAMAVAQLQSPHVVQIFDYGVERESPFIVMELLDGEDLKARLKRRGRLSLEDTATIIVQTAKALSAAHAVGIIHRDLKPGNVFIVKSRDEELVKVLDFGLAKATSGEDIDQETTKEGAILGTPRYMSPEQALATRVIDYRTDLWSLGVIAFRSLTGKVPFGGKSPADIIVRLCTEQPPRATDLAPDLPPEIDEFFERALQRRAERRFGSARELAVALARIAPASFPSLNMPAPTPEIASARLGIKPPPAPSSSEALTLPPGMSREDEDEEDEAPTIGIAGMALDWDDDEEHERATANRVPFSPAPPGRGPAKPPPPPKHRGTSQAARDAGVVADFVDLDDEAAPESEPIPLAEPLPVLSPVPAPERPKRRPARLLVILSAALLALLILVAGAIRLRPSEATPRVDGDGPLVDSPDHEVTEPSEPPAVPTESTEEDEAPSTSATATADSAAAAEDGQGASPSVETTTTPKRGDRTSASSARTSRGSTSRRPPPQRTAAPVEPPPPPPDQGDPFEERL